MNKAEATAALCEIELKNGRICGVEAIGRCATCERAFCRSHQAWSGMTYYIDRCAPCHAEIPEVVEHVRKQKHWKETLAAEHYFWYTAQTALLTGGVQPVDISWVADQKLKRGFLGLGDRYVDVVTYGRGWILGEFPWSYLVLTPNDWGYFIPDPTGYDEYGNAKRIYRDCLTALLDLPFDDSTARNTHRLVRVHSVSRGYEALGLRNHDSDSFDNWIEAAQAVKRLTGESS